MYSACFEAQKIIQGKYDIIYLTYNKNDEYFIEAFIAGSDSHASASIGRCGFDYAAKLTQHFAESALRPAQLEDVVFDLLH